MMAAVFTRYGGNNVVEVRDVPRPACGPRDVLIKVRAASVNPVDWKVRYGQAKIITGSRFPKILGNECAGQVIEAGREVTRFKPGDSVIGWPGITRLGAFAEYVVVPQTAAFAVQDLSFEQAACIPIAGSTALQGLRDKGEIGHGKKVLINGASGGVGHFAVQIAKIFGAEVTGVCSSINAQFVKDLGADAVLDYRKDDFTKTGRHYDIIFDAVAKRSFGDCKHALKSHGTYISTLPSPSVIARQYITGWFSSKKAAAIRVRPQKPDLEWMMNQISAGRLKVVIDRVFPLAEAGEALAYSEAGRAKGKIVLSVV